MKTHKALSREINAIAENEKHDFKQERMFGRSAKIPIANTFNEPSEMDFVDYGDLETFLRIRDTFPRFSALVFTGGWGGGWGGGGKERRGNRGNGKGDVLSNWLAVSGAPEIMVAGKDSRFIGKVPQEFCDARNVVLQTIIPGHHQSLGATERRRGMFRPITDHAIGNKNPNSSSRKEWEEFAEMAMMRLNSQVGEFGGFAPTQRVFGRTPKMQIGAIGNPHFEDFTIPKESPKTKTHQLIDVAHKIRQASLKADFSNKLNTKSHRRFRETKSEGFFLCRAVFFLSANRKEKGGERLCPGIIIGRFGRKYALCHFRGS